MSIPVKWFTSDMRGAPMVNGQPGSLIALLDACLLTGFGIATPTAVTVADGVATATLPSGQSFLEHAVVLVSGATPAELNGEARVLTTSTTQITWATTVADGAASGSIEIRYAPVGGWEKAFSGTNLAVYRSTDVQSNGHYLRVDDAGTTSARVRGYESMTDAHTGTGPFPTDAQMSGGGYWHKSFAANANAAQWRVFADHRFVVLAIAAGSASNAAWQSFPARGFGDVMPLRQDGDAWSTVLCAAGSSASASQDAMLDGGPVSGAGGLCAAPRPWQAIGSAVLLNPSPYTGGPTAISGADTTLGNLPSEIDGRLRLSRMFVAEQGAGKPPRADVPGVYHVPQSNAPGVMSGGEKLQILDEAGQPRIMMAVGTRHSMNGAPTGIYLVDISGPWR